MEIKLNITKVLPVQEGVSKTSGNAWRKYGFVGQTTAEVYRKDVAFSVFNPDDSAFLPQVGDYVLVRFDIESRPFTDKNGVERYSTDIRAYSIDKINLEQATSPGIRIADPTKTPNLNTPPRVSAPAPAQAPYTHVPNPTDDLPF